MTSTRRTLTGAMAAAVILGFAPSTPAAGPDAPVGQFTAAAADARVRGTTAKLVSLIDDAAGRSKTFRRLIEQISDTDGIVHVVDGQCGDVARSCLVLMMTATPTDRLLRIVVDPRLSDHNRMCAIGHELQHALEVLSRRHIRSASGMTLFFYKEGYRVNRAYETRAAIRAGNAVRTELEATRNRDRAVTTEVKE